MHAILLCYLLINYTYSVEHNIGVFTYKNFMYYITNFWALVLVNLAARKVFGNLIQLYLGTRPLSIHWLLKYIFELHFRIFLFRFLY